VSSCGGKKALAKIHIILMVMTDLNAPVHLLALDLLLAHPERRLALDHLVQQAAEAEPVRGEGVLLVVDDLGGHVAYSIGREIK